MDNHYMKTVGPKGGKGRGGEDREEEKVIVD